MESRACARNRGQLIFLGLYYVNLKHLKRITSTRTLFPSMSQTQQEKICRIIQDHVQVDAIYLYGSRAKHTAMNDSDWDIALIFSQFETDILKRALRPQNIEALLERQLQLYQRINVVDLETAPMYLQYSIITSAIKWYDRMVPHVRRVEQSILSKWEKDYERYSL